MPTFKMPLSGDVIQAINPWNWMTQFTGNQFGLFNISMGKSAEPALEQIILEDVGTYGRQLGRIGDALRVLVDRADMSKFSKAEKGAIEALIDQLDEIDAIKNKFAKS